MSGIRDMLKNLPARGAFASPSAGAVVRSAPTPYVAAHETAPPERQIITTDPTNILIRSLLMKRERDARERKARERAKAPVAAAAAAATAGAGGGRAGGAAAAAQPSSSGANNNKRGGTDPPAGEPSAKREAAAAGPSGRPSARVSSQGGGGGREAAAARTTTTTKAAATTATAVAAPTEAQLSSMTKAALVDRARRAGLAVGGTKPALVARLVEHYRTRRGRG